MTAESMGRIYHAAAVGAILLLLLFGLELIIHRSFTGMVRGLQTAFNNEFRTDSGRINVVVVLALLFIFLFERIHGTIEAVMGQLGTRLANHTPPLTGLQVGGFFIGSLVVAGILEYRLPRRRPPARKKPADNK